MQEFWESTKNRIRAIWEQLVKWQKIAIIGGAAAFVFAVTLFFYSATRTEYAILFANLEEKDAAQIVTRLKEDGTLYRLENEGRAILVPAKSVYELRLQFASEGLPQSGNIGYEIFDKNNIGVTDFVQKLNYKRALEGELGRTIQSFEEIQFARVHIMIPEPSLFIEDEKPATASVVVNLAPGKRLRPEQVEGITNLVSASVEGLEEKNVSVIDSHGKILSDPRDRDSFLELTSSQLEVQKRVESYLEEKLASLLTSVVGPDNHMVRVSAELDFNRVERTLEKYDPESSTIRSQESDRQSGSDSSKPGGTENVITNYEISKTLERVIGGVGSIKRLSVAVMLNGTYETTTSPAGEEILQYTPRSAQELQQIRELVQNAIGFSAERHDQVQVTNLPFDISESQRTQKMIEEAERTMFWKKIGVRGSIAVAALLLIFFIRSIFQYLRPEMPPVREEEEPEIDDLEIPKETKLKLHKRKMVNQIARDKPDEVAKLVKSWLVDIDLEEEEWNSSR